MTRTIAMALVAVAAMFLSGCAQTTSEPLMVKSRQLRVSPESFDVGRLPIGASRTITVQLQGDPTVVSAFPGSIEIEPGEHLLVFPASRPAGSLPRTHIQISVHVSEDLSPGDWDATIRFAPNSTSDGIEMTIRGTAIQGVEAATN